MGTRLGSPACRVVFSLIMVAMLALSMSPVAFAQDATPGVPVETEMPAEPVETPEPVETVVPTEATDTEIPGDEPADEQEGGGIEAPATDVVAPESVPQEPVEEVDEADFEFSPMAIETVSATLITQCTVGSTTWGAQMRNVDPAPEFVTFNFTDGTSADAALGFSTGAAKSYRLSGNTGKTVASITADIDTAANPNWWFQQTVGPCPGEYTVTGTVTDASTGEPIDGALVEVAGTSLTATTDETGAYSIPRVPRGQYDFVFSAEGFEPATVTANVNQATDRVVNAELALAPVSIQGQIGEYTCDPNGWTVSISGPRAGDRVQSVELTFENGRTVEATRTINTIRGASYFTNSNLNVPIVSVTASVDADFTPTSFELTSGPCMALWIVGETSDGGDAAGALVSVTDASGEVIREGTLRDGMSGDYFGPGNLRSAGPYSVTIDATAQGYNVSTVSGVMITDSPQDVIVPLERVPETYPVTFVGETSDGGSAEGAVVTIDDGVDQVLPPLSVTPLAIVAEGTLDANNAFAADLVAGEYTITIDASAQGYDVSTVAFTVPAEGEVVVPLQLQAASVTIVVESADPAIADTLPADATWTVTSVENPDLSMTDTFAADDLALPATISVNNPVAVGSYLVEIAAGPDFEPFFTIIEVTAERAEQAFTVTLIPAVEEPTTGFVIAASFYCENMSTVTFVDFAELDDDAIDFLEEDCVPGPATFTFYLVGDGTDDYVQLVVGDEGVGLIELEPGTYEMIEENTQASITIEVIAGEARVIGVINPIAADGDVPGDDEVVPTPTPTPSPEPEDDTKDATPVVTKLPSTGAGTSDSTGVLAMAAAAAAALAGAGARSLRKR
jgi:hypothetical protein